MVYPDWPAPSGVVAFTTTRAGGCSRAQWSGLNLATHVDDNAEHVLENRRRLHQTQKLPGTPCWLKQVHGVEVACPDDLHEPGSITADAAITQSSSKVCVVLTADCLPVFFCDTAGATVAVAHAGWRGLAAGVLESTVAAFPVPAHNVIAAFGPSIGVGAYEVGPEVVAALGLDIDSDGDSNAGQSHDPDSAIECIRPSPRAGHAYINLAAIASTRLAALGVTVAQQASLCTSSDSTRWYSHRRDGNTGRMASMIYRN